MATELTLDSNFDNIYNSICNYEEFIKVVNETIINKLDINIILKNLLKSSNEYIIKIISFLVNFDGILDKINNSNLKNDIINKLIKENNLSFLQQLNKLGLYNTDNNILYYISLINYNQEFYKPLENYLFDNVEHYTKISIIIDNLCHKYRDLLCIKIIQNCSLEQLNRCNNDYIYCKDAPEYFILMYKLLSSNSINLIQELIKKGVDINYITPISKNTILHHLCIKSTEGLKLIMPSFKLDINIKNSKGETILYNYCKYSYCYLYSFENICEYLQNLGADINTFDNDGTTLLYCLDKRHPNLTAYNMVINFLLKNDCSVFKYNNNHTQFIKIYKKNNKLYYQKIKLENSTEEVFNDNNKLLIHSIKYNDLTLFNMVVNPSIVNNVNKKGLTPLYYAYINKRYKLFKLLIKNGANINVTNLLGQNLLFEINDYNKSSLKKFDNYQLLVSNGININQIDSNGDSILLYLSKVQRKYFGQYKYTKNKLYIPIIKFLIEHGADVNISDKDGNNILYYFYNDLNFMNYLIEHNINLNHINNNGDNILMYIVKKGLTEKINYDNNMIICNDDELKVYISRLPKCYELICKIIKFNNKNIIYIKYDNLFVLKYCILKGVDYKAINNDGDNVLISAAKNNNIDIVNFFLSINIDKTFINKEGHTYNYYLK